MKILDMNKYIPQKKEEFSLFEAYFVSVCQGNRVTLSEEVKNFIIEFLECKDFKKVRVKDFLYKIREKDYRLFHNYTRAFSRPERIKAIKKPMSADETIAVSTIIPKETHRKFKEYVKNNKTTIQDELSEFIEKKINS